MTEAPINVAPGVTITPGDVQIGGVRSSGPGGQNVNKVATTAVLRYHPATANGLAEWVRPRILGRLAGRLTKEGDLVLRCGIHRSWERNRRTVLERLAAILAEAVKIPKRRVATRPTRGSVERRLAAKRRQTRRKQDRRKDTRWDGE